MLSIFSQHLVLSRYPRRKLSHVTYKNILILVAIEWTRRHHPNKNPRNNGSISTDKQDTGIETGDIDRESIYPPDTILLSKAERILIT